MERVAVLYSGRVQGVGFRATVRQLACGYDVVGTVSNLSDGRVEVVAEGERAELEDFLAGISESGLSSFITKTHLTWHPAKGNFRGFEIGHG